MEVYRIEPCKYSSPQFKGYGTHSITTGNATKPQIRLESMKYYCTIGRLKGYVSITTQVSCV
jgi:hypothetical protein